MKKLISIIFASLQVVSFSQVIDSPEITKEEIYQHIKYLASDELEGRFTGTEQCRIAAEYIAKEFEKAGLQPAFNGSYFQEFPFISELKLGENSCEFFDGKKITLSINNDFTPLPFSDNLTIEGKVVFAGFGISSKENNYDDYEGIDVKNKIVIVFRNHPDVNTPHSPLEQFAGLRYKATVARDKGAAGIIFVNTSDKKDDDKLFKLEYDGAAKVKRISIIQIKRDVLQKLLSPLNLNIEELEKQITENKRPNSIELNASTKIVTEVIEVESISWNVGGMLKGNDEKLSDEYVVIGAHFDHLGWGKQNSLYLGEPAIHNGADDNASGTTGVLELAEKFASEKNNLKRSIFFFAFSGEELGLLGSSYLVNHFPVPTEKVITMINMDMIGRLKDSSLIVYGTGTSTNWKNILNDKNSFGFKLTFNDEGFGPSDHSSFYGKKIPVLFFFTGTHTDYHKPSDDYDRINSDGQEKVLKYVYSIANEIINSESRPDYLAVERKDSGRMTTSRVWVGTIPDFAGDVDGYKLGGVTEGSPAALAGLKAGDIITRFGDKKISNIYDFTYAIGNYKPGDKVKVLIKRADKEIEVELELKAR
ncbi:Putative aminopeptidase [Ignavibacterium album JCM 16511]|uniref:Putative aminopeptidase n=1 Tax=Ignavibacterium album (strain DSM 19864 / JCM 16511 / NBRC 101810 / Mat9-16) TaxID=945713 RepID=I0AKT2_IGNAJ|nr:M28 family peptidase [Ignavibacterium album]AFH49589.1 Putative aminopeptidase [Ignavibacterium album JCM 16511]